LDDKALRLYPLPAEEIAGAIYEDLELPPSGRGEGARPFVAINMVASLDGRAAIGGKTAGIGDETDRRVMRTLRSKVDAVMIGANTLRAEKLSLGLDEPAGGQPLAVIATKTGDVPLTRNLIVGERQEVLVVTTQDAPKNLDDQLCESARVLRVPTTPSGAINLAEALGVLKAEHAVEVLLVEGGPSLNHALISQNLADELFLTLAPKLLGGTLNEPLTILDGLALAPIVEVKLLSAHLADSELFVRYALL
jgi:riboflavin-specific deaminase-like protein